MSDPGPIELRLPRLPQSVSVARAFVRDALTGLAPDALATASLLTSEVVTNAVLHGQGDEINISVRRTDHGCVVEVADANPVVPHQRQHSVDAGVGRGLTLVRDLSSAWGVRETPGGRFSKLVWFEVDPAAD